ncbi:MAG: xanthine dehydrogenase family protein molybdopterin-binding subunit [Chloroflexi bacterium]|nr:xanthine dehydrogenase family protein molybdopterin-binding subunit [Chloroflexota bacterium]
MASPHDNYSVLGKASPLREGPERVRGQARYTGDINLPGMLHARPVLSDYAHAKIIGIDKSAAEKIPGVVAVLAADDLCVKFRPTSRIQTLLAQERVIFCGQPVVVVIAETAAAAEDGARAVKIDYQPLPAAIDLQAAMAADAPLVWPHGVPQEEKAGSSAHSEVVAETEKPAKKLSNITQETDFTRGDVAEGFQAADLVLENTFRTQIVYQAYMETNACVVQPDPASGGLTVYSSTQSQFLVRDAVAQTVGLQPGKVRVIVPTVGGGFGAKYRSILDPLVAAIAVTLNRPISMVLTRSEDFLAGTPAPQTITRMKMGMTRDGRLTALEAHTYLDAGSHPYGFLAIVERILGSYYKVPHLKIHCVEVVTHKPAAGGYRAPGATQATFPLESQVDEMCRQLGLDPLEVRLKNAVEQGDLLVDGRTYSAIGLKECLQRASEHPVWKNRQPEAHIGYGVSIGGWTGAQSPASAVCGMDGDGTISIQIASVDISGSNTSIAMVAAEIFNVSPDKVRIVSTDTQGGIFAGTTSGSRITRTVGAAVLSAAEEARRQFLEVAADMLEANPEDLILDNGTLMVRGVPGKQLSYAEVASQAQNSGPHPILAHGSSALRDMAPGFTVQIAKVYVDPETAQIRILDWVAVQDVGFALNPLLVEGQIHGGLVQSQGWGMGEGMYYDEHGQLLSGTFMDYALPKADETPSISVELVEVPAQGSPFGARGVGEPPIIAGATALANAVRDATGVRVTSLPIRAEVLWREMRAESTQPGDGHELAP